MNKEVDDKMDRQNIGYQDEEDFGEHFQLQVEITIKTHISAVVDNLQSFEEGQNVLYLNREYKMNLNSLKITNVKIC